MLPADAHFGDSPLAQVRYKLSDLGAVSHILCPEAAESRRLSVVDPCRLSDIQEQQEDSTTSTATSSSPSSTSPHCSQPLLLPDLTVTSCSYFYFYYFSCFSYSFARCSRAPPPSCPPPRSATTTASRTSRTWRRRGWTALPRRQRRLIDTLGDKVSDFNIRWRF